MYKEIEDAILSMYVNTRKCYGAITETIVNTVKEQVCATFKRLDCTCDIDSVYSDEVYRIKDIFNRPIYLVKVDHEALYPLTREASCFNDGILPIDESMIDGELCNIVCFPDFYFEDEDTRRTQYMILARTLYNTLSIINGNYTQNEHEIPLICTATTVHTYAPVLIITSILSKVAEIYLGNEEYDIDLDGIYSTIHDSITEEFKPYITMGSIQSTINIVEQYGIRTLLDNGQIAQSDCKSKGFEDIKFVDQYIADMKAKDSTREGNLQKDDK